MRGAREAKSCVAPAALKCAGGGARSADGEGRAAQASCGTGHTGAGVGEEAGGSTAETGRRVVGRAGSAGLEAFCAVICPHDLHIALVAGTVVTPSSPRHSATTTILRALLAHSSNVRIPKNTSSGIVDVDRTGYSVWIGAALAGASDERGRAVAGSTDGEIGAGTGLAGIEATNNLSS